MMRLLPFLCAFFIIALIPLAPVPAHSANIEAQNYRRAFQLIENGHPEQALTFAAHGRDPVLNKVIRGYYLAQPGNDASFGEISTFITRNPGWPGTRGMLAAAEQKIPAGAAPEQVIDWFNDHLPVTLIGFYRYVDALNAVERTQTASALIRARWVDGDFTPDELTAFAARFPNFMDSDAVWQRLDRLLWKNDPLNARHVYPFADDSMKRVAEARIALANQQRNASSLVGNVPADWQNDAGLVYEILRRDVRDNRDDEVLDILQRNPDNTSNPELWWAQRQIMVRRMMDRRDYASAYRLTVGHGKLDGIERLQAEFLAGWLALRFLNDPAEARGHFQTLYDNAITPISRARGAYWLGRAYEDLNDPITARQAYEDAATLNTTFYGQLAAARLSVSPVIQAAREPAIPPSVRSAFYARDMIRAVERLHDVGAKDQARIFFRAAANIAKQRSEFTLLMDLAYRIKRPDLAIEAAKIANQKNMLMAAGGFPLLDHAVPSRPEPAFTHAVIRQESMFNPEAESPAGARGIMQLMPATAKGEARKLDMPYKANRLNDPAYCVRIGAAFIQDQIDSFNGSYVLALAGYNAGPHRVREWMEQIGDPRDPNVDPIDWIEEIPVPETRNYVQRILENLQVYRARLKGGEAPLLILKDLRR